MATGTTFTIKLNADTAEANLKLLSFVNNLTGALTRLLPQITAAFSFGAVAHQIDEAAKRADELGKAAQRLGIAVAELSTLSLAAKLADTDVEGLGKAVRGLADKVIEANNPLSESARMFGELGITLRNDGGTYRTTQDLLLQIADRFQAMPDGITKTRLATELFGRSGQNLIPLLNQGSEGIHKAQYEAEQFGLKVGPEFAANAEQYRDNLTRIGAIWDGMWMQLANALLPELVKFTDWFVEFVKDSGVHMGIVGTLIDIYKTFASVVAMVRYEFEVFGAFIGSFFGSLSATGDPFQAWEDALDVVTEKTNRYMARLQELNDLGKAKPEAKSDIQTNSDAYEDRKALRADFEYQRKLNDLKLQEEELITKKYELDRTMDPVAKQEALNSPAPPDNQAYRRAAKTYRRRQTGWGDNRI